jgi:ribosome-interacting GTPase 1
MTESAFRGLGLALSKLNVLVCGELKTMGVWGARLEPEVATERRETERGVEAMLEARLGEKIEELERELLSESTAMTVEVGVTRDAELDEIKEAEEGAEDG